MKATSIIFALTNARWSSSRTGDTLYTRRRCKQKPRTVRPVVAVCSVRGSLIHLFVPQDACQLPQGCPQIDRLKPASWLFLGLYMAVALNQVTVVVTKR